MKKFTSIAVVGLAAAIGFTSVAIADATVYGRVTAGAVLVDNDKDQDDGTWNFGSTGPGLADRIGFKGEQDLGNGMSAGFQIEQQFTSDGGATNKRHRLVHLSGGWGKLTLGNQNNPYMNARNWDQTYFYGGNWGASYRHEGITYSMSNGPFSLNVMAMATNGDEEDTGHIAEGGETSTSTVAAVAAGTTETTGNDGIDGWIIHAGYDFGVAALNVAHHADNKDYDIVGATGEAGSNAVQVASQTRATQLNNMAVDANASRNRTAIGINGSVGTLDWYLAYETSELNAGGSGYEDNDTTSVGGFLGFNASDSDTFYVYYVAHSGDRPEYGDNDAGANGQELVGSAADGLQLGETLGEDYTETIVGYSRDMGPGLRFIAEYASHDLDTGLDFGSDTSRLGLAIRYVF